MKNKKINYSPSIGYEGRVTISQMYGKTKLNEWTIKNTGCKPLFRFIAEALCGEFRTDLRPCTIRLFGIRNNISEQDIYNDPLTWQFSEDLAISPYIYHNSADIINESEDGADAEYVEASYTFKIPSNMISSNKIYKIALYPNNPVDPSNQRCAYIGKVDATGWAPLEIDNTNGNYALEIKWTIKIKNV